MSGTVAVDPTAAFLADHGIVLVAGALAGAIGRGDLRLDRAAIERAVWQARCRSLVGTAAGSILDGMRAGRRRRPVYAPKVDGGTLGGSLPLARGCFMDCGREGVALHIPAALPATMGVAAAGRRLGGVVELPFDDLDACVIQLVEHDAAWTTVTFAIAAVPVTEILGPAAVESCDPVSDRRWREGVDRV